MIPLIEWERCTRFRSKTGGCESCLNICFTQAFSINDNLPVLDSTLCVGCGACIGVCPTEAISTPQWNPLSFTTQHLNEPTIRLDCRELLPCLAALSSEYLFSLGLNSEVICHTGECEECPKNFPLANTITERLEEVDTLLIAYKRPILIRDSFVQKKEKIADRRAFFQAFNRKNVAKVGALFTDEPHRKKPLDYTRIKEKFLPPKRNILLNTLKNHEVIQESVTFSDNFPSFCSDKFITAECTNCMLCWRLCPSEALSSNEKGSVIYFNPSLCLKCHLCHDVCEPGAIGVGVLSSSSLAFPQKRPLITFKMARCIECGSLFTYHGGEALCSVCCEHDTEAKELLGW